MSAAPTKKDESPPYQESVDAVLASLGTGAQRGLSATEARTRLEQFGRNELIVEAPVPVWRKVLAQFEDMLVILLIVAAAISSVLWLIERDSPLPYEAIAIFAVVLLNAIMGFIQESRAESAVAALRQMAAAHANVLRDGERRSVLQKRCHGPSTNTRADRGHCTSRCARNHHRSARNLRSNSQLRSVNRFDLLRFNCLLHLCFPQT